VTKNYSFEIMYVPSVLQHSLMTKFASQLPLVNLNDTGVIITQSILEEVVLQASPLGESI